MNKINIILDSIDDLIEKAWSVPLSGGRCVVDIDKLRESVEEIRLNLPSELKEAQMIVYDRKTILDNAKKEATATIKQAQDKAKYLVDSHEITKDAREKANEILTKTHEECKQIRQGTYKFSKEMLDETEKCLVDAVTNVKKVKQVLRSPNNVK